MLNLPWTSEDDGVATAASSAHLDCDVDVPDGDGASMRSAASESGSSGGGEQHCLLSRGRTALAIEGRPAWLLVFMGLLVGDNSEGSGGSGWEGPFYLPPPVELAFGINDEVDFALDIVLAHKLLGLGEHTLGGLLVASSVVAQLLIWWSKYRRNLRGEVVTNDLVYSVVHVSVFMVEDATTVYVLTRVPGLFDSSDPADVANVATTLISAALVLKVMLKIVWEEVEIWRGGYAEGNTGARLLAMGVFAVLAVLWNGYLLIGHVALGNTATPGMRTVIVVMYATFFALGVLGLRLITVLERAHPQHGDDYGDGDGEDHCSGGGGDGEFKAWLGSQNEPAAKHNDGGDAHLQNTLLTGGGVVEGEVVSTDDEDEGVNGGHGR